MTKFSTLLTYWLTVKSSQLPLIFGEFLFMSKNKFVALIMEHSNFHVQVVFVNIMAASLSTGANKNFNFTNNISFMRWYFMFNPYQWTMLLGIPCLIWEKISKTQIII